MAAIIFHEPVFATIVESGDKLFFYEVGTTTDLTVYLDAALSTPASQPLTADSLGRFPPIYLDGTANPPKVKLTDSTGLPDEEGVQKWTADEYPLEDTAALAQDVAQLQLDVEAVEGDLLTAESEIDQLQVDVADHETRLDDLEAEELDLGNIGSGAKVRRTTSQSAPSGNTEIIFDADVFDDAGISVANVLTVPAGVDRVTVAAGFRLQNAGTGLYTARMLRNGAPNDDLPYMAMHPSGSTVVLAFNLSTGIISVSEGDTFGVEIQQNEGNTTIQSGAWMSLMIMRAV